MKPYLCIYQFFARINIYWLNYFQAFMIATPGDEQAGVPGEEGEVGVEGQQQIEAMETEGQEGQEGMDEHQQQAMVEHQQQQAATADLSSLAEAAETHHVMVRKFVYKMNSFAYCAIVKLIVRWENY